MWTDANLFTLNNYLSNKMGWPRKIIFFLWSTFEPMTLQFVQEHRVFNWFLHQFPQKQVAFLHLILPHSKVKCADHSTGANVPSICSLNDCLNVKIFSFVYKIYVRAKRKFPPLSFRFMLLFNKRKQSISTWNTYLKLYIII